MSKHGILKRYMMIIERINSVPPPSFSNIVEYLRRDGHSYSKRTVDRDIENIRYEFGIEIVYNRTKNHYYIDKERSINIETFNRFLEIAGVADMLTEGFGKKKNILNHISFESETLQPKGTEWLKPVLSAISNHMEISFTHENFQRGTLKTIKLKPYLLKEYQDRWYVVGTTGTKNIIRTYGLDRMSELKETGIEFIPDDNFDPKALFENVIGLVYSDNQLTDVVLSFSPDQGKYIKTLPLHHSQEIVEDNENECIVKLEIIPNLEFKQRILMYGSSVKVVEPEWFANEIRNELKNAVGRY